MTNNHLDDETLNALLDNEPVSGSVEHLDNCAECADRLEALRLVSNWVASPVALPDSGRIAHNISRALASVDTDTLRSVGRRAWPRWVAYGAAAGVVAIAVASAIPLLSNDDRQRPVATGMAVNVVEGTHLELEATSDLRVPVREALLPEVSATSSADSAAKSVERYDDDSFSSENGTSIPGDAHEGTLSPPTQLSPAAGAPAYAQVADDFAKAHSDCEPAIRNQDKRLGLLRYKSSASFGGEAAVVEVFTLLKSKNKEASATLDLRAYVLAVSDCRVLNVQSFNLAP